MNLRSEKAPSKETKIFTKKYGIFRENTQKKENRPSDIQKNLSNM